MVKQNEEMYGAWKDDPSQVKVSVIIAAFDQIHHLPATLDTLDMQTHTNIECFILLKEETGAINTLLADNYRKFPITCYRVKASRPAEACNRAASLSHGHYLQFLRAGDRYLSAYAIEKMVYLALENFAPDLVFMATRTHHIDKPPITMMRPMSFHNLQRGIQPTTLAACLILRSSFLKRGKFTTTFKYLYDLDWFCHMLKSPTFQYACQEFYPIEREARYKTTHEKLKIVSEIWQIIQGHFGSWQALLSWWGAHPWRILINAIRKKRGYLWPNYPPHQPIV